VTYITRPVRQSVLLDWLQSNEARRETITERQRASPSTGSSARALVLIAEDNPVNQQVAIHQLAKLGFTGRGVANGKEAVEMATSGAFALILMDVQMPDMDGFAATQAIRRAEFKRGKRTPIVAMTANALQGDRERCLAAGMDDYLPKPVTLEHLRRVLGLWLGGAGERGFAERSAANASSVIDLDVIGRISELQVAGQPDIVAELIDIFLRTTPERIEALRTAVKQGNIKECGGAAHTLKSSAANIGALQLSEACREIEKLALSGRCENVAELLKSLEREYHKAKSQLEPLRANLNARIHA
jgi:CheY-like chemotaxis protein